jgi:23S rRNA pseudouridine1911/1915/1917 synthase
VSARRWVVGAGDPLTLQELVARAGGDARAVADGRVFVGRTRATSGEQSVAPGDEISIAPAPTPERAASGDAGELHILHDGGDLIAVHKPAGVVTIPDLHGAAQALSTRLARQLGMDPRDLHPTSRLDREVSGVVVFSLTREATARLAVAREEGRYARRYVAIAHAIATATATATAPSVTSGKAPGALADRGTWNASIGRDRDPRKRKVNGRDPVSAVTRYAVAARSDDGAFALLALGPETGRTHQLRLHASHAGVPLLGDRVYGGSGRLSVPGGRVAALDRIFLHAARVTVPGARGEMVTVTDEVPASLRETWALLGGEADAWDTGLACTLD